VYLGVSHDADFNIRFYNISSLKHIIINSFMAKKGIIYPQYAANVKIIKILLLIDRPKIAI